MMDRPAQLSLPGDVVDAPLRFELVTDAPRCGAWSEAWQELWHAGARPEPMLSPQWLLPWWELYGAGRDLAVGLFHAGEQLVGLAPMCLRSVAYRLGLRFRRLGFLGADGDERDGVCSDYLNLIVRPGYEHRVAVAFVDRVLDGAFGSWDECVLEPMDGAGPIPGLLASCFVRRGCSPEYHVTTEAPVAMLPATWDAFLAAVPKKKRGTLRSAWRHFEAWAEGDFHLERATDEASLERGRAVLKSLHQQRWEEVGELGAFASARFEAFHAKWMEHMLLRGDLELAWLEVRQEPVAAAYGFRTGDRLYYYQCGRRLDVPARIRPGIVLLQLLMQGAMASGVREFDFLGGAARYKSLFARHGRPLVQLRIARASWRERLRRTLTQCNSWLRRLRTQAQDEG
jgi:CelD/BcsL family acetyltransferase involved in cellulose biosynthesis